MDFFKFSTLGARVCQAALWHESKGHRNEMEMNLVFDWDMYLIDTLPHLDILEKEDPIHPSNSC
jgi:hypothetical protein